MRTYAIFGVLTTDGQFREKLGSDAVVRVDARFNQRNRLVWAGNHRQHYGRVWAASEGTHVQFHRAENVRGVAASTSGALTFCVQTAM